MASRVYPSYLELARTGELTRRARGAVGALQACALCPRRCRAVRLTGSTGVCRTGRWARVASFGAHHGEEDCLRGWRGSGTIFFCGCNLGCVFCQNWEISHGEEGEEVRPERLAWMMLELQRVGCHNINWVSPSHVVPQLLEALEVAAGHGLRLPVVFNTGGYDLVSTLRLLDGVVDIYLPDFKFWRSEVAARLAGAEDYPKVARAALREMHRQTGDLVLGEDGLARRGLLVRHLVLPNELAGTAATVSWLARRISAKTRINLMGQYRPEGLVRLGGPGAPFADLDRTPSLQEIEEARAAARHAGLERFDSG